MRRNNACRLFSLAFALLLFTGSSIAYKLSPEGSFIERKLASRSQSYWDKTLSTLTLKGVHTIGEPVHEEITNRILGCEGDQDICGVTEWDPALAYFLAGVRWNDDPPFRFENGQGNYNGCVPDMTIRLVTMPRCWANVFEDGEKRARDGEWLTGKKAPLPIRSHFGDLQFLHAMASDDRESPKETQRKILMWAEFTWRVSQNEYDLSQRVNEVKIDGMAELFRDNGWSIQDLFALGNPHVRKSSYMAELAFGSLLHVVEDSFAAGHTERASSYLDKKCSDLSADFIAPAKIVEFHSYKHQEHEKHAEDDSRKAFSKHWSEAKPTLVEVGRNLHAMFVAKRTWLEVKPYIECIFDLAPDARESSAGSKYRVE